MSATDYVIKVGTKHAYIVNKKKTNKKGSRIGWDKRIVKDNEILQLFEFFLRRWCKKHGKPSRQNSPKSRVRTPDPHYAGRNSQNCRFLRTVLGRQAL